MVVVVLIIRALVRTEQNYTHRFLDILSLPVVVVVVV